MANNQIHEDSGLQWIGTQSDTDKYTTSPQTEKIPQYPDISQQFGPKSVSGNMPRRTINSSGPGKTYVPTEKFYAGGAPAPQPWIAAHSPNPHDNSYNQTPNAPYHQGGSASYYAGVSSNGDLYTPHGQKRICGLRRRTFFLVLGFGIIAVIAIVIGVVVGKVVNADKSTAPISNAVSANATATPSVVTSSVPAVTTTEVVLPSSTIFSDCPSANNTLYNITVGGQVMYYRRLCGVSLFNPTDPKSPLTTFATSLESCIDKCATFNNIGETPSCNTVCWKNQNASPSAGGPGACFGYTGRNDTNSNPPTVVGQFSGTTNCDAAFWINQPT